LAPGIGDQVVLETVERGAAQGIGCRLDVLDHERPTARRVDLQLLQAFGQRPEVLEQHVAGVARLCR
jgi:hypothetical protein